MASFCIKKDENGNWVFAGDVDSYRIGYRVNGKIRSVVVEHTHDKEEYEGQGLDLFEAHINNASEKVLPINKVMEQWEKSKPGIDRRTSRSTRDFIKLTIKKRERACFLWNDKTNRYDIKYCAY